MTHDQEEWLIHQSRAAIQRDLDWLKKWTNRKPMNNEKCKVLHQWGTAPDIRICWGPSSWKAVWQKRSWGSWCTPGSAWVRDMPCGAKKAYGVLGCSGQSVTSRLRRWGHTWSTMSSSGLSTRVTSTYWREFSQEPQTQLRDWSTSPDRAVTVQSGGEKAPGGFCQYIEIAEGTVQRLCSLLLYISAQWQDQRQGAQTETQELPTEHQETLFHYDNDWTLAQVAQM